MDSLPPTLQFIFQSASKQLDARGMECPQPVLECRQSLRQITEGKTLHVTTDDPNTQLDFDVFCMRSGHEMIATHTGTDGCFHFLIKKQLRSTA